MTGALYKVMGEDCVAVDIHADFIPYNTCVHCPRDKACHSECADDDNRMNGLMIGFVFVRVDVYTMAKLKGLI